MFLHNVKIGLIATYILNLFVSRVLCDERQPAGPIICLTDEAHLQEPGDSLVREYCNQIIGQPIKINIQNWNLLADSEESEIPPAVTATALSGMMSLFQNSKFKNVDKIIRLELFDIPAIYQEDSDVFVNSTLFQAIRGEMQKNDISGIALYLSHHLNETRLDSVLKVAASLKEHQITKYFFIRISRRNSTRRAIRDSYDSYIDGYLDYQHIGGVYSSVHDEKFEPDPLVSPDPPYVHKTYPHIVPHLYLKGREGNEIHDSWINDRVKLCSFIAENLMTWNILSSYFDALRGVNDTNVVVLDTMKSVAALTKYLKTKFYGGLTLQLRRVDFSEMDCCPLNYLKMLQVASDTWYNKNVDAIITQEEQEIKGVFRLVLQRNDDRYPEIGHYCDKYRLSERQCSWCQLTKGTVPNNTGIEKLVFEEEENMNSIKKLEPYYESLPKERPEQKMPRRPSNGEERGSRVIWPGSNSPTSLLPPLDYTKVPEIGKLLRKNDPPNSHTRPTVTSLVIAEPKGSEKLTIESEETFRIKQQLVYRPRDLEVVPNRRPFLAIRGPWIYRVVRDGPLAPGDEHLSTLPEFAVRDYFVYLAPRKMRNSRDFESPDDPERVLEGELPKYYIEQDRIHKIIYKTVPSPKLHYSEPQFTLNGKKINLHPSVMRGTRAEVSDKYSLLKGSYLLKYGIVYEFQDTGALNFGSPKTNLKPLYFLSSNVFYTLPNQLKKEDPRGTDLLKQYENRKDDNLYIIRDGYVYIYDYDENKSGRDPDASWDMVMNSK